MALRGSGLSRSQAGALQHPGIPAGWLTWTGEGAPGSAAIGAADTLYLYPFRVSFTRAVNLIFTRCVTGGAGSAIKCAVWANDTAAGRPTGLPPLGQNAGFDTTGAGDDSAAIGNVVLAAGMWWAGVVATGTMPTMLTVGTSHAPLNISAGPNLTNVPHPRTGYSIAQAYATDILTVNLTGAALAPLGATQVPQIGLGWA